MLTATMVLGQAKQLPSNYEHMKSYDALIGTWVYDGPLLEDVPELAKKGTKYRLEGTLKWILNNNAIEEDWKVAFDGGVTISVKALTGWDVIEKRMICGGMGSDGGYFFAAVTFDEKEKTWVYKTGGVGGDGKKSSENFWMTLSDANTLVIQSKNRAGLGLPPESPKYILKKTKP